MTEEGVLHGGGRWDPDSYARLVRREVPAYERLQEELAHATLGLPVTNILELGTGTGETARRVLAIHPGARLHGIDASAEMIAAARKALPADRASVELGRLEDQLPPGPFDLVVSALAIHHLAGLQKAALFGRVSLALRPGGRFVLADLVVPMRPEDAVTPLEPGYDVPSSLREQMGCARAGGADGSDCLGAW